MADGGSSAPVAIITGGGSGIGRAVAGALADRGHRCLLVGRREPVLAEAAASLATPGAHVAIDLTGPGSEEAVIGRALEVHGRVDVIVHAAGVFEKRDLDDTDDRFWLEVLDVNLTAVMRLTRAGWAALSETGGQVVLISSIAAVQGFPGNAAYAASKGGMNALGEVLRLEGRAHGIRVLTVCPGQTDTEIWNGKAPDAVRAAMMDPAALGGLVASLVELDRGIDVEPIVLRPAVDPWAADESSPSAS